MPYLGPEHSFFDAEWKQKAFINWYNWSRKNPVKSGIINAPLVEYALNQNYYNLAIPALGWGDVVATGNFLTRNYRQKIILDNDNTMPMYVKSGLTNYKRKGMSKPKSVPKAQAQAKAKAQARNRKNKKTVKKVVPKKSLLGLNKQIQDLRKAVKIDLAKHTYKSALATSLSTAGVGRCQHTLIDVVTPTLIEGYMAGLRYYDPSAPATLVTADASTGSYSRDVHVKNIYSKLNFCVTNMTPVRLRVYLCKPKRDTSSTVIQEYTNGIADQVITAGIDTTDALLYLTDIERVKENWEIDVVFDKVLPNGGQATVVHNTGAFDYDPSHFDSETAVYQKRHKAFQWVARIEGMLGHDTSAPNARTTVDVSGVDYQSIIKAEFEYDAGTSLNDIVINETRAQSGTTFVTGLPVVPDNVTTASN